MDEEVKVPLRTIVDLLPVSIFWMNNKMEFLGCNIYQARMIGLKSPDEIIGKTPYDFIPKHLADILVRHNHKVIKGKKTLTFEEERICPDGSKEIYFTQKSPLYDQRSRIIGLLGVAFNITDQKENELNRDIVLEEIITNLPGNVYWKNRQGIYKGCNGNIAKMAGLSSPTKIIGKSIRDIYPGLPKVALNVEKDDEEVMEKEVEKYYEEKGVDANKKEAYYITHKVPLKTREGRVTGMLGLSFDITARVKAEEALKVAKEEAENANKAKSEFMELMTHELRTPLTGILGILHNLMKKPDKTIGSSHQLLENMRLSGQLLLAHINDILDYAKLRKNQFDLHPSIFNLKDSILSTIQLLTPGALKKNITLKIDYPKKIPSYFYADKNRVTQILFNIIGNAVKFTQKGYVKVSVSCISHEKNTANIKISISDSGPGIPADKHEIIFNKFEQLRNESSSNEQQSGTGLGLAIVKKLVQKFKGSIKLDSKMGKGSTFHITLPLTVKEKNVEVKNVGSKTNTKPVKNKKSVTSLQRSRNLKGERYILLVEDNIINQTVIEEMLKDLNHNVLVASNGKEALKLFEMHSVGLVFLDINLPDIDGFSLADKMLKKTPRCPIVALTANTSDNIIKRCNAHGMKDVVGKPVDPVQLTSVINAWIS